MLKSIFVLCPLTFLIGLPAAQAAQPEAHTPYHLQVVLHVAKHRLLTDVFRDRVERELRDGLQASLGELARVEVVRDHPRLPEVLDKGLQRALDGWKERSEVKTHFVLIDFSGSHYEIQARQHDGLTGQASPVVRRDRTRDRDFVARVASLLVDRDFGMVGTVVGSSASTEQELFKVQLHGGALDVPLERWVKKDDVFAVVPAPPGSVAVQAEPFAFLQVVQPPEATSHNGTCLCRFYHRRRIGSIVGYRCLKLATMKAPVRLRLAQLKADGSSGPLQDLVMVEVRRHGFDPKETPAAVGQTDPAGGFESVQRGGQLIRFDQVAFVTIKKGRDTFAQVPLVLVEDRLVGLTVQITTDPGALLAEHRDAWTQKVRESYLVQAGIFEEINKLSAKPDTRAQAMQRAEEGLKRTQEDYRRLLADQQDLLAEAGRQKPDLTEGEKFLKQLKTGEEELQGHLARMRKIEEEENDPKRKEWRTLVEQGLLLEKELEFEKAIALYKRILQEGFQNEELQKHVADLEKRWNTEDPNLKEARRFIYNVWPKLDTPGLKKRITEAEAALQTCITAKDLIGPQKMAKVILVHATRLSDEQKQLNEVNIDDEKPLRDIKVLLPQLRKLNEEIEVYLEKAQP